MKLQVGNIFKLKGGRKFNEIVHIFELDNETYIIYRRLNEYLLHISLECNLLKESYKLKLYTLEEVNKLNSNIETKQSSKSSMQITPKSDFEKFRELQKSGIINMTDIVRGASLCRISEESYTDILFNYNKYDNTTN